jgi:hypothetical protein
VEKGQAQGILVGVLDAMRTDMGYSESKTKCGEGKTKCGEVKGRLRRVRSLSWTASRRLERSWGCGVMGKGLGGRGIGYGVP